MHSLAVCLANVVFLSRPYESSAMQMATVLLIILVSGLASQWLAAQIRLPAIVVLIAVGLLLGPVTGTIDLQLPAVELTEMIGLGVAIILFEGGMDLKTSEFRREGHGIGRLTLLAPPMAWLLGGLAAHYVAGLSWPVSWVLGAILVVTGPTVILPLLRQARLNKDSASLLKWEGIVNDPVGVLLAVLTFQYFTLSHGGWAQVALGMGSAIAAALVFGGLGGWVTGWLYRRGSIPTHLKAPMLLVLVLVCYWASNRIQHEAGLLSVTLMGLVIGNMKLVERETLRRFQENLTVVLLSVLFIVIPSQLDVAQLAQIDWRVGLFVLVLWWWCGLFRWGWPPSVRPCWRKSACCWPGSRRAASWRRHQPVSLVRRWWQPATRTPSGSLPSFFW